MDAFTPRPRLQFLPQSLLQQGQAFTGMANPRKASVESETSEATTSSEDTFEATTKDTPPKPVAPPPTDKTASVMTKIAAIASLGTVFGVGMLFAQGNKAELKTSIAALDKKLDQLLKDKANSEDVRAVYVALKNQIEAIKIPTNPKVEPPNLAALNKKWIH